MNDLKRTRKNGRDLFKNTSSAFIWRHRGKEKSSVPINNLRYETETRPPEYKAEMLTNPQ
jgi:hypothetical protein